MTKSEFISELRKRLSGIPIDEIEERVFFYAEMIDDRVEEGRTEEEAVGDIGSAEQIAEQIIADTPLAKIAKEKFQPKSRFKVWEIILLALGAPIWLSLAVAALSVVISLYAVLWSLIASAWAVFSALGGSAVGFLISGVFLAIRENAPAGIALIGLAFVSAGLAIFAFFGCISATRGVISLTKKIALAIKKCFVGKEKTK